MSSEPGGMGLFSDIFLFSMCLILTGILIFILIYFIITLSDLECDYLNAEECCGKLNFVSILNIETMKHINQFIYIDHLDRNSIINRSHFSVEYSKTVDAVFYRGITSMLWPVDIIRHQSSNMYISR